MRAHIHGGPEQVKNAPPSRPDTLMQDRITSRTVIPLATRGRTIHWGQRPPRPRAPEDLQSVSAVPQLTAMPRIDTHNAGFVPRTDTTMSDQVGLSSQYCESRSAPCSSASSLVLFRSTVTAG